MAGILLQERTEDGILILTLNRPETMNCFNFDLLAALAEVIREANFDMALRCIVITGAPGEDSTKGRFFNRGRSEGAQKDDPGSGPAVHLYDPQHLHRRRAGARSRHRRDKRLCLRRRNRTGPGLRHPHRFIRAIMGLTETSLAIIPGAGGTQRLPRIVGIAKAKELIFTARRIDAKTALEIGLVNRVVEPDRLMPAALEMAREIAKNGPIGVAQAKFAINNGMEASLGVALPLESKAYEVTIPTKDRLEALAAFAEKRKPVFKGE